jgi:hypothetical protein
MESAKLQRYLAKKFRELSEAETQQIRDRIGRGDDDVFELAVEFNCVPTQVAGIKAIMNRGKSPEGAPAGGSTIRALSIRQPWAHAILHLGKDVENRSWPTPYRGSILVHASAHLESHALEQLSQYVDQPPSEETLRELPTGCMVGVVDLVDIIEGSKSKWAEPGQWHWILQNPKPIEPIECNGRLRLWTPPAKVLGKLPDWLAERFARSSD